MPEQTEAAMERFSTAELIKPSAFRVEVGANSEQRR
jgi:hypothetical protein